MQYWVVGLFVSLAACTFDSSAVGVGGRDGASIDAPSDDDASVIDGSVLDAGAVDARLDASPPQLLGVAVTRHYIDEAVSGDVVTLMDSVPTPTNLTSDGVAGGETNPQYREVAGNRGVEFDPVPIFDNLDNLGSNMRTEASIGAAHKIRSALQGTKVATIELVVDVTQFNAMGRLVFLGNGQLSDFALHSANDANSNLTVTINHDQTMTWTVDLAAMNRKVVHLVLDTASSDRAKLYIDGVDQGPGIGGMGPGEDAIRKNEAISVGIEEEYYVLGNRETGGRPVKGVFYYAALYGSALTPAQVANNAAILLINDDAP